MASAPKAMVYSADGEEQGETTLDASVFGTEPNMAVMHQVVTAQRAAARSGTAKTKTRAEVRGGGRKPWRQKGLGRARHGSIRSPQWRGGGTAFGPKPRDYSQRTPKKMKRLALRSALSARAADGQIRIVDKLEWDEPKTKQARVLLRAVGAGSKALVVVKVGNIPALKSFRNLTSVTVIDAAHLAPYDVLWSDTVLFSSEALEAVTAFASEDKRAASNSGSGTASKAEATADDEVTPADGPTEEPASDGGEEE
ncbi:MAG: 50S ribosomal protein L4 [Acidimicrobiia bacterium]|nr:50S ribosomal protein L4 [Acidimicrobiia bacterium]